MSVSLADRQRFRLCWRQLAQEAQACVADPGRHGGNLRTLAQGREWVTPSPDRADILACAALKAVALSYEAETGKARRAALAPALAVFAAAVGDLLDATDPALAEPAPILPLRAWRADIDG